LKTAPVYIYSIIIIILVSRSEKGFDPLHPQFNAVLILIT